MTAKTYTVADTMANVSYHEISVRRFAEEYPTPNVARMIHYCESGTITWTQAYELACKSLHAGIGSI